MQNGVVRRAALAGIVGQVVLTLGWLVGEWAQDGGYSIARHDLSDLGAIGAPHAWIMLVGQGVCGVCTIAFAFAGLRPALAGIRGRTVATLGVALSVQGLDNLSDSLFRLDCRAADGCTQEQSMASWHGMIHGIVAMVTILVIAVAPFLVGYFLRRAKEWADVARWSMWLGVVIVLSIGGCFVESALGYSQRVLVLASSAWIVVLAARVLARSDGPAPAGTD